MITNKKTFFLAIFIFITPFLGLPSFWKTLLVTISGLLLLVMSIKVSIPKKTTRTRVRKEKINPVFVENVPLYDRRINTPTQSGRRVEAAPRRATKESNKEIV